VLILKMVNIGVMSAKNIKNNQERNRRV